MTEASATALDPGRRAKTTSSWLVRLQVGGIWLATRLLILIAAAWGGRSLLTTDGVNYLDLWNRWETPWYDSIAQIGYQPAGEFFFNTAYFPGFPGVLWVGHHLGLSSPLTGMLAAAIATLFASFALARLTTSVGGYGPWGTLAWALAPIAVFAVAPWTEALFCAFAFWAWAKAREGRWLAAGLLAATAATFRANGIFLTIALIVMFALASGRRWREGWPLVMPALVVTGFFGYLWAITGDPRAWFTAQEDVWNRTFTWPWDSLVNTYDLIFTFTAAQGGQGPHSRFIIEILAVAGLVLFTAILAWKRWWAESVYVALTLASLGTGVFFQSVPRSYVVLMPVWMLVGLWLTRHRWLRVAYVIVGIPSLILVVTRFAQGEWIS